MSQVIIRQNSTLVDAETLKPVMKDIKALKKHIEQEEDEERRATLELQLEKIKGNSVLLIDLRKKSMYF